MYDGILCSGFCACIGGHVFALLLMLVARNTNTCARGELRRDVKVVFCYLRERPPPIPTRLGFFLWLLAKSKSRWWLLARPAAIQSCRTGWVSRAWFRYSRIGFDLVFVVDLVSDPFSRSAPIVCFVIVVFDSSYQRETKMADSGKLPGLKITSTKLRRSLNAAKNLSICSKFTWPVQASLRVSWVSPRESTCLEIGDHDPLCVNLRWSIQRRVNVTLGWPLSSPSAVNWLSTVCSAKEFFGDLANISAYTECERRVVVVALL